MARKNDAVKIACTCSRYTIDLPGLTPEEIPAKYRGYITDTEDVDGGPALALQTGCTEETWALFAPGHDARLAGLFQTAVRSGGQAILTDGGLSIAMDAVKAAADISEPFAAKVAHTPAPKVRKAKAAKADETPAARPMTAKVGRWTYDGHVDAEGMFTWTTKDGVVKWAEAGKWTPADAEAAEAA